MPPPALECFACTVPARTRPRLAIREQWLPRFIEIGEVLARWHAAAGPDLADFVQDAHAQVREATHALRANLPYLAPFKAVFDKDKVRRRQQDLQG